MSCFRIVPKDQPHNNFLTFIEPQVQGEVLRLKNRYLKYACRTCRKVHPDDVIREGFDCGLDIRVRGDFSKTADDFYIVNQRIVQIIRDEGIKGGELIPLKGTSWFVLNPTEFATINPALIENFEICPDCMRPKYNCGIITRDGLSSPLKAMTIFATDVLFENLISGMRGLLATADVVGCFKAAKVRGLEYLPPR